MDTPFSDDFTGMIVGYKARYVFSDYDLDAVIANVEFAEAMFHPINQERVNIVGQHSIYVFGESKQKRLSVLFDAVAEYKAKRAGLVL